MMTPEQFIAYQISSDERGAHSAAIHDYRAFAHPLAQIKAVLEFRANMSNFVSISWEHDFVDAAPAEKDLPTPVHVLTALQAAGLRFERSSTEDDRLAYWDQMFEREALDVLLYGWAHEALDALALDSRVFWGGLHETDLIFVPDHEGVVAPALTLLRDAERDLAAVEQRLGEDATRIQRLSKTRTLRAKKGGRS